MEASGKDSSPCAFGGIMPKAFTVFRSGYGAAPFMKDLGAGLTVGVVALPLAMAFAIASGATPERGLFTAIVGGFLISLLGGSRYQIGGPTGAFVVIVASVITRHGWDGLVLATLMAGLLLVFMGVMRLGALIKYIPYPVTTGFTAGIAVLIFSSQMKDFLGLRMDHVPAEFFEKWEAYAAHAGSIDARTLGVSLLALATIVLVRRFVPRIPAHVAGVLAASLAVFLLNLPVETIGSRFGGIPRELPSFVWPELSLDRVRLLLPDAMTIALLAGIESLLSCVVADGMTGSRHDSNTELVGQGVANVFSALFGGFCATGAIARTVTGIKSGAFSPMTGMIHALTLVLFVLFLAPLASYIPLASLAAVLVVVAFDMSELRHFRRLLKAPKSDVSVMCLTFALTVVIDLTVAVYVGVMLASLLFMRRMSEVTRIAPSDSPFEEGSPVTRADSERLLVPTGVEVYEIDGPFFFGVADRFQDALAVMRKPPWVFILRMRKVPAIDATAVSALESFADRCRRSGSRLVLSGVRPHVRATLERLGAIDRIGKENVFDHIDGALERALRLAVASAVRETREEMHREAADRGAGQDKGDKAA